MKPTDKNTYAFPLIGSNSNYDFAGYATVSYKFADAMLAERVK